MEEGEGGGGEGQPVNKFRDAWETSHHPSVDQYEYPPPDNTAEEKLHPRHKSDDPLPHLITVTKTVGTVAASSSVTLGGSGANIALRAVT